MAPLEIIEVNEEERVRILFQKDLSELKHSMDTKGQINAITVNQDLKLIAGYGRYTVAKMLGWKQILVYIRKFENELEELDIQLIENIHRKDFSSYEIGKGLLERLKLYVEGETRDFSNDENYDNLSQLYPAPKGFIDSTEETLKMDRRTIQRHLRIMRGILNKEFDEEMIEKYKKGQIPYTRMIKILKTKEEKRESTLEHKEGKEKIKELKLKKGEKESTMEKEHKAQQIDEGRRLKDKKNEIYIVQKNERTLKKPDSVYQDNSKQIVKNTNYPSSLSIKDDERYSFIEKAKQYQKKGIDKPDLSEVRVHLCKECNYAEIHPCPYCLVQIVLCRKATTYSSVQKLGDSACTEFSPKEWTSVLTRKERICKNCANGTIHPCPHCRNPMVLCKKNASFMLITKITDSCDQFSKD